MKTGRMRTFSGKQMAVILGAVVAAAAVGAAYASIPDSTGVIHGCYDKAGNLRVIDPSAGQKCVGTDTAITWNRQGPQGNAGPAGPPGPRGHAGSLKSLDDLEGLPCKGVNGKPASVHLDYGTGI